MTSGAAVHSDPDMVEPWKQRTPQAALQAKAARLRARVAETNLTAKTGRMSARNFARRAIVDCENLLDLADQALRLDWIGS